MCDRVPYDLRAKYTRFRILVIGRANAGKTTVLQRVCNTTEDPCIYDENNKNLVSVQVKLNSASDIFYQLEPTSGVLHLLLWISTACLTLPIQRAIHNIHRSFAFKSNPGFIFHDSPGFETGDERQLWEVLSFIEKRAKSNEVDDQLHAIWSVSQSQRTYWPLIISFVGERFCFVLNNVRPLLPLETAFFETARAGTGFYHPNFSSSKLMFFFVFFFLQYPSSRSLPNSTI